MAVVFISPKKRQKTFFVIITLAFLLFVISLSLGVFLSKPKSVSPSVVFNKTKINIDMGIFDSEKFKNLQASPEMGTEYSYKAIARNKKTETGFISAESADAAKKTLEALGLTVTAIEETKIGRDNPFIPYYPVTATPVVPPPPSTTTGTSTSTSMSGEVTTTTTSTTTSPAGAQTTTQ